MTRLEELQPSASVRGVLPTGLVAVVSVQWFWVRSIGAYLQGRFWERRK